MLVLQRKDGEKIHIGTQEDFDNGTTTVVTIFLNKGSNTVDVGIDAARTVKIMREELLEGNNRRK